MNIPAQPIKYRSYNIIELICNKKRVRDCFILHKMKVSLLNLVSAVLAHTSENAGSPRYGKMKFLIDDPVVFNKRQRE